MLVTFRGDLRLNFAHIIQHKDSKLEANLTGCKIAKVAMISAMVCLSGCSTVSMPDINLPKFSKISEFFEGRNEIDDYPDVTDAPSAPTDIRADAAWDNDAKNLIKLRDEFKALENNGVAKSDAQITQDLEALKAKVRAYKADDPQ